MSRTLILFVDGLPHYELRQTSVLRKFPVVCGLKPTFGFSPNIYAELYAGLTADDVGFFNEWGRDEDAARDPANRALAALAPALDLSRKTGLSSTLAHRIVGKLVRHSVANIPFGYLQWYSHQSIKVYDAEKLGHETLFSKYGFDVITGEQVNHLGIGYRDEDVFARGLAAIRRGGNVYLSFVDYDNLCHRYGVASSVVRDHLKLLDHWVQLLVDTFHSVEDAKDDGVVFLLSDHGMLDVREGFDLRIEEVFGLAHPDDYLYFPDSVMCRVWSPKPERIREIAAWLDGLGVGRVVPEEERSAWGVTKRAFGDLLFVLDPGICFQQNFHGWRLPKAMHGYHPDNYSQFGVFLADGARPEVVGDNQLVSSLDAHAIFEAHLAEEG